MYGEIGARSENLVKNGVSRRRSGERVNVTLKMSSYLPMDDSLDRWRVRLTVERLFCKYLEVQWLCVQRSVPNRRRVEPALNWAAEP